MYYETVRGLVALMVKLVAEIASGLVERVTLRHWHGTFNTGHTPVLEQ